MANTKDKKIFKGRIEYFEYKPGGMLVDWFKLGESADKDSDDGYSDFDDDHDIKNLYFVSHAHADHLEGLAYKKDEAFCERLSSSPRTKIYCTEITKEIILRLPSILEDTKLKTELKKHFRILESNGKTEIDFYDKDGNLSGEHMTVKTIPANHIPGAVMFLFDDGVKRALYTGDFRYDVREEDNEEMKALQEFVKKYDTTLDYLYVDVTWLDLGRLYHPDQNMMPSKTQIKKEVCRLIEERGVESVHLNTGPLGAEEMVKAVAERFNNPVDGIIERLSNGCRRKDLYEYLLKDIKCTGLTCNTTLHISYSGKCKVCELKIRATVKWVFEDQRDYSFDNPDTWTSQESQQDNLRAIFSHHSSDYELREFLHHLKFKEVYPISIPFDRNFKDIDTERLEDEAQVMQYVREGLYYSIDSSCLKRKRLNVFYFSNGTNQIDLSEFKINEQHYKQAADILNVIKKCPAGKSIDFVLISCSSELRDSIGQMDCNMYNFIDVLWNGLVEHEEKSAKRNRSSETKAVILYTNDKNYKNERISKFIEAYARLLRGRDGRICYTFYLDLTKIAVYTEAWCKQGIEVDILQETLSNIVRNQDREVYTSDWPLPYKYSERKRKYDLEGSSRRRTGDRKWKDVRGTSSNGRRRRVPPTNNSRRYFKRYKTW